MASFLSSLSALSPGALPGSKGSPSLPPIDIASRSEASSSSAIGNLTFTGITKNEKPSIITILALGVTALIALKIFMGRK